MTNAAAPPPRPLVRAVRVERETVRVAIHAAVILAPGAAAIVAARASGVVTQLFVETSSHVRAGDRLATIETAGHGHSEVRAPIDGLVAETDVVLGQPVEENRTRLMTLVDPSTIKARAEIDERYATFVHPGMEVELRVPAFPNRVYRAKVEHMGLQVGENHTFPIECVIPNPDQGLFSGMSATVQMIPLSHENALSVPHDAVLRREGRPARVFVVKSGRANGREVALGIDDGGVTEIVAGLTDGERVLTPAALFHEGDAFTDLE